MTVLKNKVKANKMYVFKKPIEWVNELEKEINQLRNRRMIKDIEIIKDDKQIIAIVTCYEYQSE